MTPETFLLLFCNICLCIWIIIAVLWALKHTIIAEKGISPGGIPDYFLRVFIAQVLIFISLIAGHRNNVPYPQGIYELIGLNFIYCGWFWIAFDIYFNKFFGKPLTYVSFSNGKIADHLFSSLFNKPWDWIVQFSVKVLLILVGTLIFINQ
jgi:hypothetical protein